MDFPINVPQLYNKTHHGMEKVWEIDTHTFPIVWLLFSHQIPIILWYTLAYICKMHGFPHKFPIVQQNATKP